MSTQGPPNNSRAIILAAVIGLAGTATTGFFGLLSARQTDAISTPRQPEMREMSVSAITSAPLVPELPDLEGEWYMETYLESATHPDLRNLRIRYRINVEQDEEIIRVHGRKTGEVSEKNGVFPYPEHSQFPILLSGKLKKKFGDLWELSLEGHEDGLRKKENPLRLDLTMNQLVSSGDVSAASGTATGRCVWVRAADWKKYGKWALGEKELLGE